MNGDKKSLGELIQTMNEAKVDSNVGMLILFNVLTKTKLQSFIWHFSYYSHRCWSTHDFLPYLTWPCHAFDQYWHHTGR